MACASLPRISVQFPPNLHTYKNGIDNIHFNLLSLNILVQILFNDINHDIVLKQCTLSGTRIYKKRHFSILLFACTYFAQFSIKMNEIFRTYTKGLNAGKHVSDFLLMS